MADNSEAKSGACPFSDPRQWSDAGKAGLGAGVGAVTLVGAVAVIEMAPVAITGAVVGLVAFAAGRAFSWW